MVNVSSRRRARNSKSHGHDNFLTIGFRLHFDGQHRLLSAPEPAEKSTRITCLYLPDLRSAVRTTGLETSGSDSWSSWARLTTDVKGIYVQLPTQKEILVGSAELRRWSAEEEGLVFSRNIFNATSSFRLQTSRSTKVVKLCQAASKISIPKKCRRLIFKEF